MWHIVPRKSLNDFQDDHWSVNVRELESVIHRAFITRQRSALKIMDHCELFSKPDAQDIVFFADLEQSKLFRLLQTRLADREEARAPFPGHQPQSAACQDA